MIHADNRTSLIENFNRGQVFFFAGSGISYLSKMPSAGKILLETSQLFLPQQKEYQHVREMIISSEKKYQIQPELFYEALLYLFNSNETLMLWKSVSSYYLERFGLSVAPNINHLFIVDYSVKNHVPIFTTNFDCLFEEAAKELGYDSQVFLPHTEAEEDAIQAFGSGSLKNEVAYIFKLHGSISINETDSLDSFYTTMISITKANYSVIQFLENLCFSRHIVFVGYSGRDIDYFPEIKRLSISYRPYWIDRFHDSSTKDNCKYINALQVKYYPNEIFENEKPELNHPVPCFDDEELEIVFNSLKLAINQKIDIKEDDKLLLLGLLTNDIGEYQLSYKLLLSLYRNNSLCEERQVILLLALSNLAHENSRYESCGFFAKEALRESKHTPNLESFAIRAMLQKSESKRMLVAHDAVFFSNINYLDAALAFFSFMLNAVLVRKKVRRTKCLQIKTIADIFLIHGYIEHKIRFFALIQAFFKPIIDKSTTRLSNFLSAWLIKQWQEIRRESLKEGHSHGIATSYRFETRIKYNVDHLKEGSHIFEMRTYSTGKGLSLRNTADQYYTHGEYSNAKERYHEFFLTGLESGNKLNAIKGLFGIAKCNKALSVNPPLSPSQLLVLKSLIHDIEGKNWQRYFSKVLTEIEN